MFATANKAVEEEDCVVQCQNSQNIPGSTPYVTCVPTGGAQEGTFEFHGCHSRLVNFTNPVAVSSCQSTSVLEDGAFSVDVKNGDGEIIEDLIVFCRVEDGKIILVFLKRLQWRKAGEMMNYIYLIFLVLITALHSLLII